jgi:hypothetical protein
MLGPANEKGRKKRQIKKQVAKEAPTTAHPEPSLTTRNTVQSPPESALCASDAPKRRADPASPIDQPNTPTHETEHHRDGDVQHSRTDV